MAKVVAMCAAFILLAAAVCGAVEGGDTPAESSDGDTKGFTPVTDAEDEVLGSDVEVNGDQVAFFGAAQRPSDQRGLSNRHQSDLGSSIGSRSPLSPGMLIAIQGPQGEFCCTPRHDATSCKCSKPDKFLVMDAGDGLVTLCSHQDAQTCKAALAKQQGGALGFAVAAAGGNKYTLRSSAGGYCTDKEALVTCNEPKPSPATKFRLQCIDGCKSGNISKKRLEKGTGGGTQVDCNGNPEMSRFLNTPWLIHSKKKVPNVLNKTKTLLTKNINQRNECCQGMNKCWQKAKEGIARRAQMARENRVKTAETSEHSEETRGKVMAAMKTELDAYKAIANAAQARAADNQTGATELQESQAGAQKQPELGQSALSTGKNCAAWCYNAQQSSKSWSIRCTHASYGQACASCPECALAKAKEKVEKTKASQKKAAEEEKKTKELAQKKESAEKANAKGGPEADKIAKFLQEYSATQFCPSGQVWTNGSCKKTPKCADCVLAPYLGASEKDKNGKDWEILVDVSTGHKIGKVEGPNVKKQCRTQVKIPKDPASGIQNTFWDTHTCTSCKEGFAFHMYYYKYKCGKCVLWDMPTVHCTEVNDDKAVHVASPDATNTGKSKVCTKHDEIWAPLDISTLQEKAQKHFHKVRHTDEDLKIRKEMKEKQKFVRDKLETMWKNPKEAWKKWFKKGITSHGFNEKAQWQYVESKIHSIAQRWYGVTEMMEQKIKSYKATNMALVQCRAWKTMVCEPTKVRGEVARCTVKLEVWPEKVCKLWQLANPDQRANSKAQYDASEPGHVRQSYSNSHGLLTRGVPPDSDRPHANCFDKHDDMLGEKFKEFNKLLCQNVAEMF